MLREYIHMKSIAYIAVGSAVALGVLVLRARLRRQRSPAVADEVDDRQVELIRLYAPAVQRALAHTSGKQEGHLAFSESVLRCPA